MFLYIIKNEHFEQVELQQLKNYTIKNNIYDADIYLDEPITDFSLKLGENSLIEFFNIPAETVIQNSPSNYIIEGDLCSVGDLWLTIKDSSLFFTTQQLNLDKETLNTAYNNYIDSQSYYEQLSTGELDTSNEHEDLLDEDILTDDPELIELAEAVKSAKPVKTKWMFKHRADNPLLLNLQYFIEDIFERINRSRATTLTIICSIILCILLIFLWTYHSANAARTKQMTAIEGRKTVLTEVNKYLINQGIINRSVYIKYGTVMASGLIRSDKSVNTINSNLVSKFKETTFNTNFITMPELYSKIEALAKTYNLQCKLESDISNLACVGIVEDKDSVQEQAFNFYQYNNIVPVEFNLYYVAEINSKITQLLSSNPVLNNLTADIIGDNLIFIGYIRHEDLAILKAGVSNLFTSAMPHLTVIYKVRFIEDIIKLQIKELLLTDFGNSFIDQNNNQYSIGSTYQGFKIKDIQKNYVIFYDGNAKFVYPTPFSENKTEDSTSNLSGNLINVIPSTSDTKYSESSFSSVNNTRDAILNEEKLKMKNDIIRKQAVLKQLNEAKRNNTNDKLGSSYDDLISNLVSDLKFEQQELNN